MKNLLVIIVIFLLPSCIYDPPPSYLNVINSGDQSINIVLKIDTVQSLSGYGAPFYTKRTILSKDTVELMVPGSYGWQELMGRNRKNRLYLFSMAKDALINDKIDKTMGQREFKAKTYTQEQLNKLDWMIIIK